MLALTRREGESIIIEDPAQKYTIEIKLVQIIGNRARLSFEAPRNVQIYRKEIYEARKQEVQKPYQSPSASQSS